MNITKKVIKNGYKIIGLPEGKTNSSNLVRCSLTFLWMTSDTWFGIKLIHFIRNAQGILSHF